MRVSFVDAAATSIGRAGAAVIWIVIAAGGALGAMARHALNGLLHQRTLGATFPYGILVVNVVGSGLIGLVGGLVVGGAVHLSYTMRTFVLVGLLGGFTTFSSFSFDTLALARDGHAGQALLNVVAHVGLGLLAVWAGFRLGAGR
jgi:CrcB protein